MRRQFCPRVALDCCNIDRRAGTEHADAMANGNGLSHADLGADSRPELAPGGHQFFCSCCRTVLSLRTAAPAAAKEPTTDPIAAAATGSAGDGAVQSSAGKSGPSPAAPARWGVSAGGGMVRPKSWRFAARRGAGDRKEFVAQEKLHHPRRSKEQLGLPVRDDETTEPAQERRAGIVLRRVWLSRSTAIVE